MTMFGEFKNKYFDRLELPDVHTTDIVEIIIIAFLIYEAMVWVKKTRARMLFKGILVILVFVLVAAIFQMSTILWIAERTINVALIALVIIFQPELRSALEQLGRKKFITSLFSFDFSESCVEKFSEKTINELVKAAYEMGKVKTGALIVIENEVTLSEYERTGITLDSVVSSQLLINIFEKNTPLHDGAIIVRGDRVISATCYLPLSDNMGLSKELGTRHRAAVGISEVSDSLTIELYRNVDAEFLRSKLKFLQNHNLEQKRFSILQRRLSHVKKGSKASDK